MKKRTDDELKRDLTFDNYSRYAILRDIINFNRKKNHIYRILDVGGRGNKLREFLPEDNVFYLDPGVETKDENYIKGDGCEIPLENDSFDWVVSAEVFEHIEKEKREDFLNENIRVAKLGVILTAPFYSKRVFKEELEANKSYKRLSGSDYPWLKEHIERGLPREDDLEDFLANRGFSYQKLYGNRSVLWQKLIEVGFLISYIDDKQILKELKEFNYFYNNEVYPRDFFEPSHRKIYFVKKKESLKNLEINTQPIDQELTLRIMGKILDFTNQVITKMFQERLKEKSKSFRWKISSYFYKIYTNNFKKYIPQEVFVFKDNHVAPFVSSAEYKIKNFDFKKKIKKIKIHFTKDNPRITIGIASYNHSKYLRQCINSALGQDYRKFDIVIIDDGSSDPNNKKILQKYEKKPNIQIIYKRKNEGISQSLNDQVISAKGDWVAFLDCDDYLPKDALSKVVKYLRSHPNKKMIYSNRFEVDGQGSLLRKVWFGNRAKNLNVYQEFKKGMVSSHLKIIHKDVFSKIGIFDKRFGGTHDYDFFLRAAFYLPDVVGFIDDYLYYHRIHSAQNTKKDKEKHKNSALTFKREMILREKVYTGKFDELISVIILSFNRGEQLKKTINSVTDFSKGIKKQIIIFDNNSSDKETLKLLKEFEKREDVEVVFSEENLRCPGGRKVASNLAKGKYWLYLDNDIEIREGVIEELILRVNESEEIGGACCRVIFPNGYLQFNGGELKIEENFASYILRDKNKNNNDISTMTKSECDWIPGGATLFKKACFEKVWFDDGFLNAYSDLDLSLQLKNAGYKLVNCPNASVVHYHISHVPEEKGNIREHYNKIRNSNDAFIKSWVHFYKKWNLIINDDFIFGIAGLSGKNKRQIQEYLDLRA